jgi:hypothetical protein
MGHRDLRLGRVAFLKQGASGGDEGGARQAEQLAFETRLVLLLQRQPSGSAEARRRWKGERIRLLGLSGLASHFLIVNP